MALVVRPATCGHVVQSRTHSSLSYDSNKVFKCAVNIIIIQ